MAHPRTQALLNQIESYLHVTGLSSDRFGVLAAKNGRLVDRLRHGGRLTFETAESVETYLANADWTPRRPRKRRKPREAAVP